MTYQLGRRMKKAEFEVIYKDGLPKMVVPSLSLIDQCKEWEGLEGKLTLEVYGKNKSNRQNRYFRGVLIPHFLKALRNAGYQEITKDSQALAIIKHYFFKNDFKIGKTEIPDYLSTCNKDWSTKDWESKIEEIRIWTIDKLSYDIPPPNEPDYNEE